MSTWRFALLRLASHLVPAAHRAEWLAEWVAELTYVQQHRVGAATSFCLGAFRDACWLRRHTPLTAWSLDSPVSCLGTLTALAGASALLGLLLPLPHLPLFALPFQIALALVILPAVTTFTVGECPSGRRARYWQFLAIKVILAIPAVWFVTLDVAAAVAPRLQVHGLMAGYILAFRWILTDQRRRCPVCLRRVVCPTRIGSSSYMLLGWYGTEFICSRGHGLLHVPAIPSSAYGAPSWQPLDGSWSGLFVNRPANRDTI